jgi:homoserine dehydrogenase
MKNIIRIADVEIKDKESIGFRKSNLSRSKGHVYKYMGIATTNDGSRKVVVKFNDMTDKKQLTRVGFYKAKGLNIELIALVSLEGRKDVILPAKNMIAGKMLKIAGSRLIEYKD